MARSLKQVGFAFISIAFVNIFPLPAESADFVGLALEHDSVSLLSCFYFGEFSTVNQHLQLSLEQLGGAFL